MEGLYDATTLCVLLTLPVYDACIWLCCIGGLALSRTVLRRATVHTARLAQSAERKALNLVVVGSSPTVGAGFVRRKHARTCMSMVFTPCGA